MVKKDSGKDKLPSKTMTKFAMFLLLLCKELCPQKEAFSLKGLQTNPRHIINSWYFSENNGSLISLFFIVFFFCNRIIWSNSWLLCHRTFSNSSSPKSSAFLQRSIGSKGFQYHSNLHSKGTRDFTSSLVVWHQITAKYDQVVCQLFVLWCLKLRRNSRQEKDLHFVVD